MNAPDVKCRCCGQRLPAEWQQPIVKTKPGFWYLTCANQSCQLAGQTFTDKTYATVDLAPYLCNQIAVK